MKTLVLDTPGLMDEFSYRYSTWFDVFGEVGIVSPEDLVSRISGQDKLDVSYVDSSGNIVTKYNEELSCDLFIAREFSYSFGELPNLSRIDNTMTYLESLREAGKINTLINSRAGTMAQKDKLTDIDLVNSLDINAPNMYHFDTYEELASFMGGNSGNYVVKHRFGADSFDISQLNESNLGNYVGKDLNNYVVCDELDISYESRIIMFNGEYLGARQIIDRTRPWEEKGNGRKHEVKSYTPSDNLIEKSAQVMNRSDIALGCVDWVGVEGTSDIFYLETNGAATGYGYPGSIYDLNRSVALHLREYAKQ
ncbi:MAG: hypothetical protein ACI83O_000682 [Patescibacteria group bacterium]|jgi:hypothetical protein